MRRTKHLGAAVAAALLIVPSVRKFVRWRTARLLEQVDADARALVYIRDVRIPKAIRLLAEEKLALLQQWELVADGKPAPAPNPDPIPSTAAASWSPSRPAWSGLFTKRSRKK